MGYGRFEEKTYRAFASSTVGKSTDEVYTSRHMDPALDPKGVKLRESRDSPDNPNSTPLIVGIDVTGSMGMIADVLARKGLGTLFTGVLERKPISDPHVMFMAIGDANYDRAPLQVSQFEASAEPIIEQLTKIWIEHGGGGNQFESYNLPWYFAGFHTEHDSMVKRGKRGYLFTVGDEERPADLTRDQLMQVCGDEVQGAMTTRDMLAIAQRTYDVYHVIIEEGDYARRALDRVVESWVSLLGQHVIRLQDHTMLSETIISAIEVAEGHDAKASADLWKDARTAKIVYESIKRLPPGKTAPRMIGE